MEVLFGKSTRGRGKDEDKPALASKFLDSLRTDACVIAEDQGPEVLGSKDNISCVIEAVRKHVFSADRTRVRGTVQTRRSHGRPTEPSGWRADGLIHRTPQTLVEEAPTNR